MCGTNVWEEFVSTVFELYGITEADVKSRKFSNTAIRNSMFYLLRMEGLTLEHIGRLLHRHHATFLSTTKRFEQDLQYNPSIKFMHQQNTIILNKLKERRMMMLKNLDFTQKLTNFTENGVQNEKCS